MAAITDLSTASSVDGGEFLVISQSGTDKKLDVLNVAQAGVELAVVTLVASGGTADLSSWTPLTLGVFFLIDTTGGNSAIFMAQGGGNNTIEMVDTNNQFSDVLGTGSSVNFDYDGGYKIRNNQAQNRDIAVFAVGV